MKPVKQYETEVRFNIPDPESFREMVENLGCELVREHIFRDDYFMPDGITWNSAEKSMRMRVWELPKVSCEVYLAKQEIKEIKGMWVKRSIYAEGKRKLFEGSEEACRETLADMGYEYVYSIYKKHGWVWQNKKLGLEFCAEDTDLLGWTGEMELVGTDLVQVKKQVKKHQDLLGISDDQISYKPIAQLIEEKIGWQSQT